MSRIGTREEYHNNKLQDGILTEENCPFCNFSQIENTLIHELQHWKIILNKYPYSGEENHLMAVPHRHIPFPCDLNTEELTELAQVHRFMKDFFETAGEKNYFSATRETMGNRSVEHYHMHFIPGKLQGKFLRCMLENQGYPIEAEVKIQKQK